MDLAIGTRLDRYEIVGTIGAGGMGEVYRAFDTRIRREVAVKILPDSFAADENRLLRFQQEARTVGALNHPNILSVHDIGAHNGIHYMVTELLNGETLRQKVANGALPPRRATEYAIQIAQGLASAHEKGVVHRDLKPENIFVTADDRVKILDFGLARVSATSPSDATLSGGPNTSPGIILGTVGYMAPEQIRGEAVDHRADIFSFGTTLYEMLAGHQPFKGGSSVETMNAILKEEPSEIAPKPEQEISPALQSIVRHCLEKERNQRFQSAKDLTFALGVSNSGITRAQTEAAFHQVAYRKIWATGAALLAIVLAITGIVLYRARLSNRTQPSYSRITFRKGAISAARFAPDGQTVVYSAAWDHPRLKLYSSHLDGTDVRALDLPPSELLSISTSAELATIQRTTKHFLSGGRLARAPLSGGAPRDLLDNVIAADWSRDSNQLAVARISDGKCRIEYPVGNSIYETLGLISHMRFSPQTDAIAFMEHPLPGDDRGTVVFVDLKGNKRTLTQEWNGEQGLAWSPDGREVWFTATDRSDWDRGLYAVSRSGKQRLVLRSPAALYLEDIAGDGRVLLRHEERRYEVAAAQRGEATRILSWLEIMLASSMSSNGEYAVIGDWSAISSPDYSVYFVKLDGSPPILLGNGIAGGISPDNKWVASILPSDTAKVLLLPTGVGETKTVTAPDFHYRSAFWTSDGQSLIVLASKSGRPVRFWRQPINGDDPPRPVTPEGTAGLFLVLHGTDYVSVRNNAGAIELYPIDGHGPKPVTGLLDSDEIVGSSAESDVLYVTPDSSAVPQQILKVNLKTSRRDPFITLSPSDPAGIIAIWKPIFSKDENRWIYNQARGLSILYIANGLK